MISPTEFDHYRPYLKAVLAAKNGTGGKLSLRSLAQRSGISPSYLSRIINGERALSVSAAARLSHVLDFTPEEESHMMRLLASEQLCATSDQQLENRLRLHMRASRRSKKHFVKDNEFKLISEWYHFAILSLVNTRDFDSDPKWIAERLGIDRIEAAIAFERLVKLGFLKRVGHRWEVIDGANIETPHDELSKAVQLNHYQHLAKASAALESVPLELREFTNTTLPLYVRDVKRAKRRIRSFFDRFIKDMERAPGDELFQLNIQFYQLTQRKKLK